MEPARSLHPSLKPANSSTPIEHGVATFIQPGQTESGDKYVVRNFGGGILIAVIDGLGHGDEAAAASNLAVSTLELNAEQSVISLLKLCHKALMGTRGAVMSLASINLIEETVTWIGVGNVEAALVHSDTRMTPLHEHVLIRGGVVGYNLPHLQATVVPIIAGDLLIFKTDGISEGFDDEYAIEEPPQKIADRICTKHAKGTDDGLVVVIRYKGGSK
ncbi:MAG TPA: SpoIIE family protein phosphatase [Bacteroidota bacterium]|nr:SpoIIE family protein phosphatase [Bacteroidota bacterium]